MSESKPVSPYGSAKDIPKVQRMEQEIAGLKVFKVLLGSSCRRRLEKLEQEHGKLADKFYSLLGERNWAYRDDLKVSLMEIVINTSDPAVAEERLISYCKERGRVRKSVVLLEKFDDMRPRLGLLK